ncbi:hypothetical protein GQ53DRAFT_200837 [Thozetella sp. PMI_491]|nr:hypothetical protein GQ53DRAFT_200837 [Thozetella sp. PMI_491]
MSLTTASQISYRAQCARAASVALATQQTRGFRFGFRRVWSLDSEPPREACGRRRSFRYKYIESTSASPAADGAKAAPKGPVHNYWAIGGRAGIHGGRYANADTVRSCQDNPQGVRPGQNIEDVERSPMEHLLFGEKEAELPDYIIDPITNRKVPRSTYGGVDIPVQTFKSYRSQFVSAVGKPQSPIFYDGAPPEAELAKYDQVQIDAEPWDPASAKAPQETVTQSTPDWSYRGVSWHRNDGIISSAGSSIAFWQQEQPPADLDKYKPVMHNESQADAAAAPPTEPSYEDLGDYNAVRAHEPDGKYKPQAAQAAAIEYEDLDKYGAVKAHEPDGKYKPQSVVDPAEEYEDLDKYTAVRAHEPDGKYKTLAVEDPTQEYEDLNKYGAIRAHEPDGKYKVEAVQDPVEEYADLHKYNAVRAHEPDGKYKVRDVQDPTQEYDDLHTYKAFRAHEPDGKYKIEAVAVQPEELVHLQQDPCLKAREAEAHKDLVDEDPTQQYEDLHKYGPVRAHEPDGMYKVRDVRDPTQEYDDLHKYGAYRAHEPDGMYKVRDVQNATEEYEDLHKYTAYRSHEPDGKYAASYVEPKQPKDLTGYGAFRSHEPDGKYAATHVKPKVDNGELGSYKAYRSHEPDGKYAESYQKPEADKQELSGYKAFRSHEPDGKYAAEEEEGPNIDQAELGTYKGAFLSHEPDGKYAMNHQPEEVPQDLDNYGAFRSHEPNGKYAAQAATASSNAEPPSPAPGKEAAGRPKYGAVRHYEPQGSPLTEPTENHSNPAAPEASQAVPDFPKGRSTDAPASELQRKTNYREMLESIMARIAAESDSEDSKAAAVVKELRNQTKQWEDEQDSRSLTGSYIRDFPEDFARTWSTDSLPSETLLPGDMEREARPREQETYVDDASAIATRRPLQTALDRQSQRRSPLSLSERQLLQYDPYSHEPQGLQTSYVEEIGDQSTWPALVKHYYKAKPVVAELESTSSASQPETSPEPILYKILAYDRTMQVIDVAETSSVVPDQATPLSPAEVILRLSNPAKFFPHFAPLQAEGFEIVSGSGDVLIFRKVRSATASEHHRVASKDAAEPTPDIAPINPIDMTGGQPDYLPPVAAARYASPTGFVNYDQLPSSATPRFASGIDVRREEPVFSGEKRWSENEPKRPGFFRRVTVGAVFLGGVMYSVGVVRDYFKTGGSDGRGPKGL